VQDPHAITVWAAPDIARKAPRRFAESDPQALLGAWQGTEMCGFHGSIRPEASVISPHLRKAAPPQANGCLVRTFPRKCAPRHPTETPADVSLNMAPTTDHSPRSTVVALVGADSDDLLAGLHGLPALVAMSLRGTDPAETTRALSAAATPYVVHDADPLEHVAAAWVELYGEQATLGTLEIEVDTVLAQFESGEVVMPDYYLVAGPDVIEGTWRHWWLGALAHRAPSRVLPVEASVGALRARLRRLPTSRPWPEPAEWLRSVHFDIPDRVGLRDERGAA
jgi:hypothetical protein